MELDFLLGFLNDAFIILNDILKARGFKLKTEGWSLFLGLDRAKYFRGTFPVND